ncbi:MAG: thioredoxin [Eubacterium sp.]|nr:thioredoxin [Eubacterium sp.]
MAVLELNDANFESEVIASGKTVLVDFFAEWCGPCKMMSPIIDEIAEEKSDIVVGKVDVDEAGETAMKYGIMSIPTIMVFKGGELSETFVGLTDKDAIINAL